MAIITFPILTKSLSVEEYGTFDLFGSLVALMSTAIVFGQDSAVARYIFEYPDREARVELVSQSLLFQLVVVMTAVAVLCYWSQDIASLISASPASPQLFRLALVQSFFLVVTNFCQNLLKWTFSRSRFLVISIGSVTVSMLALVGAAQLSEANVVTLFSVGVITQAVFGLAGLWFIRKWLRIPTGLKHLRETLPFAVPYGVIGITATFVPAMQRALIGGWLGQRELGLFAAGAKVALAISIAIQAFQVAWGPFSLSIAKGTRAAVTYNYVLKVFVVTVYFGVFLVSSMADVMLQALSSSSYSGGAVVVCTISAGLAIEATGWITAVGITLSKRSYFSLFGYAAYMGIAGLVTIALVGSFGVAGAAWGTTLGLSAKAFIESWLAQKVHPLPWRYREVLIAAAVMLAFCALVQTAATSGADAAAGISLTGALAIAALAYLYVFTAEEKVKIRNVLGYAMRGMPS